MNSRRMVSVLGFVFLIELGLAILLLCAFEIWHFKAKIVDLKNEVVSLTMEMKSFSVRREVDQ